MEARDVEYVLDSECEVNLSRIPKSLRHPGAI